MKPENERILTAKFKDVYDNHLEEMPGYKDMKFDLGLDVSHVVINVEPSKRYKYRRLKMVSLIVAVFICSSAFGIAISNGSVEAGRDRILDFINSVSENDHMISDEAVSFEVLDINDSEGVKKAKDIMPNLFVSESVSDGYLFDNMQISKLDKSDISITTQYYKGDEELVITQDILNDNYAININEYTHKESFNNGDIYEIIQPDINIICYINDEYFVEVMGTIDINALEEILKKEILINF